MVLRRRVLAGGLAALAAGCAGPGARIAPSAGGRTLLGPVDAAARQKLGLGGPPRAPGCALLEPVRDLAAESFYIDPPVNSVADPARIAANRERLEPLRRMMRAVQDDARAWVAAGDGEAARCAAVRLATWANASALLGAMSSRQASFERKWATVGLALPWLAIRDAPGLESEPALEIGAWFGRLAAAIVPDYGNLRQQSNRNNHQNWAGAAVMLAGVAANDARFYEWGLARFRFGVDQIQRDGSLPEEVARGRRALHYHLFALTPLVLMAETMARNGLPVYERDGPAMARLVDLIGRNLPEAIELAGLAGAPQEPLASRDGALRLSGDLGVWAEAWTARFDNPPLRALVLASRPLRGASAGGDWSAYFGPPAPQTTR